MSRMLVTDMYDVLFRLKSKNGSTLAIEGGVATKHLYIWVGKDCDSSDITSAGVTLYGQPRSKYFEGYFASLAYCQPMRNCCESDWVSICSGKKFLPDKDSGLYTSGYTGFQVPTSHASLQSIRAVMGLEVGWEF